ncbi:uncharacterized protein LOC122065253 [Macadamia integrifolia]|uniref:uncharacterized protein LOC122065253 n=1 Tax=Macadamia integrifolia TaxID=60698 RepID=UPI001C4ECA2E|nr:uncharacterized protein LOC122065253 [Macadamia integrifolia]
MASEIIEKYRGKAEICHGEELCKKKSTEMLVEMSLPNNLLPVEEIEEVGHNREIGFFWLKLKKAQKYKFPKVGDTLYATEITGFIKPRQIKDLKGVTAKELFLTFTLSELYIDDPSSDKINCKTTSGLHRKHPISCFELPKSEKK